MSKIYLLRVCAYLKPDNGCNAYAYTAKLFSTLEEAVEVGKREVTEQLEALWVEDSCKECYKSLDDFCSHDCEGASYIFEVEERTVESLSRKRRDRDDMFAYINDPDYIEWRYDLHGELTDRVYCFNDGSGISRMPHDERPDAGMLFKKGDLVVTEDGENVYVVAYPPELDKIPENVYLCYSISGDEFGFATHYHLRECDMRRYTGEVSEPLKWLSDLFAERISVPQVTFQEIINGKYSFSPKPSFREITVERKDDD